MNTQVTIVDSTALCCINNNNNHDDDDDAAASQIPPKIHPSSNQRTSSSSSVCSNNSSTSTKCSSRCRRSSSYSSTTNSTTTSRKGRALRFQSPTTKNNKAKMFQHLQRSTPYDDYYDVLMSPIKNLAEPPTIPSLDIDHVIFSPTVAGTPTTTPTVVVIPSSPIITTPSSRATPFVVDERSLSCFVDGIFNDDDDKDNDGSPGPVKDSGLPPRPTSSTTITRTGSKTKTKKKGGATTTASTTTTTTSDLMIDYNNNNDDDDLQSKDCERTVSTSSISTTGSSSSILTTSSRDSRKKTNTMKKQVSFPINDDELVFVHEELSKDHQPLTQKEKQSIWYTRKEATILKQNIYVMARLMNSNIKIAYDDDDDDENDFDDHFCTWGLHQYKNNQDIQNSTSTTNQDRRIMAMKAVLEEQELQRKFYNGSKPDDDIDDVIDMNIELIATIYTTMTKESSYEAHQRGVDMYNELVRSKQLRRRRSSTSSSSKKNKTKKTTKSDEKKKSKTTTKKRGGGINLFRSSSK